MSFIKILGKRNAALLSSLIVLAFFYACNEKVSVDLPPNTAPLKRYSTVTITDPFQPMADAFADSIETAMFVEGCPGLAITIIHDSKTLIQKGFGIENANSNSKIDTNTVFRLGSVSKGFAAILTHILVKEKYLSWDDKVTKYVPDFKLGTGDQTDKITIKTLLSQSTGLPPHTFTNQIENGLSLDQVIPMLADVKTVADTGKICTYQNVAYAVIEKVIEGATGKSFESLINEKVFLPLSMKTASTNCESMWRAEKKATPHRFNRQTEMYEASEFNEKYYNAISAGGINASIADMNNYLGLLLGQHKEILDREQLDAFFQPVVQSDYERRYFHRWDNLDHNYYARGWRVFDYNGERWMYHGGFVNGFRSEIALNPKYGIGICILFNSTCKLTDYSMKMFFDEFIHYNYCEKQQL